MNAGLIINKKIYQMIKILLEKELTRQELIKEINISIKAFYKYLEELKKTGFNILKYNECFKITTFKNTLILNKNQINTLAYLLLISLNMMPDNDFLIIKNAINMLLINSDEATFSEVYNKFDLYQKNSLFQKYEEKIDLVQKYINQNENVIVYISKNVINIIPKELIWQSKTIFLRYFDLTLNKQEKIEIDKIHKISSAKTKLIEKSNKDTIFELYNSLAKKYLLKKEEYIIDSTKEKIVIGNTTNNKEKLFRRLMRYDTLCKVIFPKKDVQEMFETIKKSLDNIT